MLLCVRVCVRGCKPQPVHSACCEFSSLWSLSMIFKTLYILPDCTQHENAMVNVNFIYLFQALQAFEA